MPTMKQFNDAANKLTVMGWEFVMSMMVDDAKKEGVTEFGRLFTKNGQRFWLNFKTIWNLPE